MGWTLEQGLQFSAGVTGAAPDPAEGDQGAAKPLRCCQAHLRVTADHSPLSFNVVPFWAVNSADTSEQRECATRDSGGIMRSYYLLVAFLTVALNTDRLMAQSTTSASATPPATQLGSVPAIPGQVIYCDPGTTSPDYPYSLSAAPTVPMSDFYQTSPVPLAIQAFGQIDAGIYRFSDSVHPSRGVGSNPRGGDCSTWMMEGVCVSFDAQIAPNVSVHVAVQAMNGAPLQVGR
jgi:hypothetical protein